LHKFFIIFCRYLPFITEYVTNMCAILVAGAVKASPREQSSDPTIATLRYENSLSRGPTNKPERFIIISSMLIMTAAPVVPTSKSCSKSPNKRPNDGSIARVASYEY
jgi:hypothetical protein